jgi:prepilin-type N-terminal cleavage/methylation domain-containing protein
MKPLQLRLKKIHNSSGFTLIELMVSMTITLGVTIVALQALSSTQKEFTQDTRKIDLSQKNASILDVIGRDIRQAGEQIEDPKFPVVKMFPNPVDANKGSSLVLYRAVSSSLPLCTDITTPIAAGTTLSAWPSSSTTTAVTDAFQNCKADAVKTGNTYPEVLEEWKYKRTNKAATYGVIYDNKGNLQPFTYGGEVEASSKIYNVNMSPAVTTTYELKSGMSAYLVEKKEYLVCGTDLMMRLNSQAEGQCPVDNSNAPGYQIISSNIDKLELSISMRNQVDPLNPVSEDTAPSPFAGTTFPVLYPSTPQNDAYWKNIQFINVKVTSKDIQNRNLAEAKYNNTRDEIQGGLEAQASFYPRNVMSSRPIPTTSP